MQIDGYDLFYKCREEGKGGGVAFFISKTLKAKVIPQFSIFEERIFESLTLQINVNPHKKILVTNIYRPPTNNNSEFTQNEAMIKFLDLYNNLQDL